ncbi:MAG: hypothetical protein ORN54_00145 [Cyclobacteriaceae bacterium]|nr:hypothetical protein [Cyclobacteriaceae bacterium]
MQTRTSIIITVLLFSFSTLAQEPAKLKAADSLFRAKQYTQSYSLYDSILSKKSYSAAMLLKMAFIQEGLNHTGLCLYYLTLYQKTSDDHQAAAKMEELAEKNRLEGYRPNELSSVYHFFEKNNCSIAQVFSALIILSFSIAIFQKKKKNSLKVPVFMVVLFSVCLFATLNWTSSPEMAIVSHNRTYLMGDPSAGASVIEIIGEGHRMTILEKKDVWLRVKWRDKDVYVKENNLLPIVL